MSLLLDALNRARREQRDFAEASPRLDATPRDGPALPPGWLVLIVVPLVLLVVLLGSLGWFLWRGELHLGSQAGRDGGVPETRPTTPVGSPVIASGQRDHLQVQKEVPTRESPDMPETRGEAAEVAARLPSPAADSPAAPGEARVAALYQSPPAAEPTPREAPGELAPPSGEAVPDNPELDVGALARKAEELMKNQKLEEHSSPWLEELSQARKDAIPSLMYVQHDYQTGGGSRVTINRQQAGAGGTVAPGVQVEEILPDSVVLSFRGETFRLRALNSWVNL